jgi:hypothetical protein
MQCASRLRPVRALHEEELLGLARRRANYYVSWRLVRPYLHGINSSYSSNHFFNFRDSYGIGRFFKHQLKKSSRQRVNSSLIRNETVGRRFSGH